MGSHPIGNLVKFGEKRRKSIYYYEVCQEQVLPILSRRTLISASSVVNKLGARECALKDGTPAEEAADILDLVHIVLAGMLHAALDNPEEDVDWLPLGGTEPAQGDTAVLHGKEEDDTLAFLNLPSQNNEGFCGPHETQYHFAHAPHLWLPFPHAFQFFVALPHYAVEGPSVEAFQVPASLVHPVSFLHDD
ncbi:hypothetical protein J437_LFUL012673 [Ladona fulva]|uniref:Uncharacterized protein n=1 Tax=Ladona fulva TaxID=123851 RepID=A0A8K0KCM0_LADFU|nr:hypothetical protein J437_LFUL012673 [Ladona fulva]